jgi:hypothetical protein
VVRREVNHAGEATISFDVGKLRTGLEVIANQLSKELAEDNPVSPVVRDESAFILVPTKVPIRENEYATA